MGIVLDAGALLAVERGDRQVLALLKRAELDGLSIRTPAPVVGQVWRGGSGHQAGLARYLKGVGIVAADEDRCRAAGLLLRAAGSSDVVDALVVEISAEHDEIMTSDARDIGRLAAAAARRVAVTSV